MQRSETTFAVSSQGWSLCARAGRGEGLRGPSVVVGPIKNVGWLRGKPTSFLARLVAGGDVQIPIASVGSGATRGSGCTRCGAPDAGGAWREGKGLPERVWGNKKRCLNCNLVCLRWCHGAGGFRGKSRRVFSPFQPVHSAADGLAPSGRGAVMPRPAAELEEG